MKSRFPVLQMTSDTALLFSFHRLTDVSAGSSLMLEVPGRLVERGR